LRIAVVQHQLRPTPAEDADAMARAAEKAAEAGAELVIFPEVFSLQGDDNPARDALFARLDAVEGERLIPQVGVESNGFAGVVDAPEGFEDLGLMAVLIGDGCVDMPVIRQIAMEFPDMAVMIPRSESELQAEAILEFALALSDSFAGLVLIAETDGAEPGEPGHGGSAIIRFGEIVAEAGSGDDVLVADIEVPIGPPSPRERLPIMPPILEQRLANHEGRHLEVDYPADLSEGTSER